MASCTAGDQMRGGERHQSGRGQLRPSTGTTVEVGGSAEALLLQRLPARQAESPSARPSTIPAGPAAMAGKAEGAHPRAGRADRRGAAGRVQQDPACLGAEAQRHEGPALGIGRAASEEDVVLPRAHCLHPASVARAAVRGDAHHGAAARAQVGREDLPLLSNTGPDAPRGPRLRGGPASSSDPEPERRVMERRPTPRPWHGGLPLRRISRGDEPGVRVR